MKRLRSVHELDARDLARWRELADRAAEPNPFFDPDFVLPAATALRRRPVGLLTAGDWDAAVPVVAQPARRDVLLPVLAVWRHAHSFLGTPLVADGAVEAAIGELVGAGRRAARGVLALDWVSADGPVGEALAAAAGDGAVATDRFERATVRRRDAPTYLDGRLSGQRRKGLRRQARGLAEAAGGELEAVDLTHEPGAVEAFLQVERAGWKGAAGTAMACDEGHARFFAEACARFARRDALQLLALRAGERTVAMQCNFRAGDGFFCFKVAYNEAFARFSPGAQLEILAFDVFHHQTDAAWMDSCAAPDAELINRLWPDRRALTTLIVPSARPLGRSTQAATRAARGARSAVHRARAARDRVRPRPAA